MYIISYKYITIYIYTGTDRQAYKQKDRQTDKQTDRQTERRLRGGKKMEKK